MAIAPTPLPHHNASRPPALVVVVGALFLALVVGVALLVHYRGDLRISSTSSLEGSGVSATQIRHLPPFAAVELAGGNNVIVHVGGSQTVTVVGDDNLVGYVTTRVSRDELVVGQSRGFATAGPMHVEIGVRSLDAVVLSGSGALTVDGVQGDRFTVDVPGSGVVTATGAVDRLDATLSGSGDVRLQALAARDVVARLDGSGRLHVSASHTLDAGVSGSGAIVYSGEPARVAEQVTGSGAIVKG